MNIIDMSSAGSHEVRFVAVDAEHRARLRERAFDGWREAEAQVRARWEAFVVADRPSRRRAAFAAYVVALDGEAAAADALARMYVDVAAAA